MSLLEPSFLRRLLIGFAVAVAALFAACSRSGDGADRGSGTDDGSMTIGVAFDTLQTEFWVASIEAFREELASRDIRMLESVADGDANRQLDQVRNFITRKVDGIIVVPKDANTIIPAIKAANRAGIPIVCFNRPPAKSDASATSVVADNYAIASATVEQMVREARKTGRRHKALLLIGDLGDVNAIGRRDGFDDVVAKHPEVVEVVARVPTEWNQEKAQAGVVNALQANPDISFIFTSSDFLLPSIVSALKAAGKYHRIGEEGHVLLGGFDGDATAYRMLADGFMDADGVQDVYFEVKASVQAIVDAHHGEPVPETIQDPGFVIHQGNLDELAPRMWGANVKR